MNQVSLIMMGAGESSRFREGGGVKKQWLRIGETPLWKHVSARLSSVAGLEEVFITASPKEVRYMQKQCPWRVVEGGASRQESLQNALLQVKTPWVLVSDVARFDVPLEVVERALAAREGADCVVPILSVSDTVYYEGEYLKREGVKLIQTPQLSRVEVLRAALEKGEFTDESSAILAYGGEVKFIEGSERAKKLTHPHEITLLRGFEPPFSGVYVGSGFDVHAFEEGDSLRLAGVSVPASVAFKAHSDGDVAIHALIDAILGAVGAGDIGEWFPDSSALYAGIDSAILLREVMEWVRGVGFEIHNVDLTVMAQAPKLSPYKAAMERRIAEILEVEPARVSLKATTTELLGFVGRKEGIAVMANATLKLRDWTKDACFNR